MGLSGGLADNGGQSASVLSGGSNPTRRGQLPAAAGTSSRVVQWVDGAMNVQAFGAVPGADCSTAVLAAIAAAPNPQAVALYFPGSASAYKLNLGTLGTISSLQGVVLNLIGDGESATFLAPVDATHPLFALQGPADSSMFGFAMRDLCVQNTVDRAYDAPLIQLTNARAYSVERVLVDGGSFTGTFLSCESSYNSAWRDVTVKNGKYLAVFEHTNALVPLQECDNFLFERCDFNAACGWIFRNATGSLCRMPIIIAGKVVQSNFYSGGAPAFLGILSAPVSVSDTTASYTATAGAPATGDLICVGNEGNGKSLDLAKVTNVAGGVITVSATTPFRFAHATGAPVQSSGIPLSIGDKYEQAHIIDPHFEGGIFGVVLGNVAQCDIVNYEAVVAYHVGKCASVSGVRVWSLNAGGNSQYNSGTNTIFQNTADAGAGQSDYGLMTRPNLPSGSPALTEGMPSAATYQAILKDTGGNFIQRRNTGASSTDRAFEITVANAKKAALIYNGIAQAMGFQSLLTGGGTFSLGSGAPTTPNSINPVAGDLYWRTDTGQLYLCITGGGSPTWTILRSRTDQRLVAMGLVTESFPIEVGTQWSTSLTSQTIYGSLVGLNYGDVITNLGTVCNANAVNVSYLELALLDTTGAVLKSTGDVHATLGNTGPQDFALSGGAYTVATPGGYFIAQQVTWATTQPTMMRTNNLQSDGSDYKGAGSGARRLFSTAPGSNGILSNTPITVSGSAGLGAYLRAS